MINFIRDIRTRTSTSLNNIAVYDTNKPENSTATQYVIFKGITTNVIKNRDDFILTFDLFDKADSFINIYTWMDLLKDTFNYCNIETNSVSYHSYEIPGRYTVPQQNEDDRTWKHGVTKFQFKTYLK